MSGEGASSSLFFGELTDLSRFGVGAPFSVPDADPPDGFRSVLGLDATRPGAKDKRPAGGRAAAELVLEVVDDVEGCRVVLEAGRLGGPMEGRPAPTDGRGALTPTEATRAFDGVAVRELEALDEAVASCLVGDLVGDWLVAYQHRARSDGDRANGQGQRDYLYTPSLGWRAVRP